MKTTKWLLVSAVAICASGCRDSLEFRKPTSDNIKDPTVESTLPPNPGAEGKLTLSGIDTDNDGVRDDVQIAIHERYPSDEMKKKALGQTAKSLQFAILSGEPSEMFDATSLISKSVDCLHKTVEDPIAEIGFLERVVVNTKQRSEAYIKFNQGVSGQFFGGDSSDSPCE